MPCISLQGAPVQKFMFIFISAQKVDIYFQIQFLAEIQSDFPSCMPNI